MTNGRSRTISRESLGYLTEKLYGSDDGLYPQTMEFVFSQGELSHAGRMAVLHGALPNGGPESIHVGAKLSGGIRLAKCLMSRDGRRIDDYCFVTLPSEAAYPMACSYSTADIRKSPNVVSLFANFSGGINLEGAVEHATRLNQALQALEEAFPGAPGLPESRIDTSNLFHK